ncbi:mRNA decay activator protein ZFP36L1 isoform 1-T1 [Synchiropus picturatus]
MPSHPFGQFSELEEMMCKQLLNLDFREQNQPSPLSPRMRTPGYVGQAPRCNSLFSLDSLSSLPSESSDNVFMSGAQWGQQAESDAAQWGKRGFWSQRSVSMVETGSGGGGAAPAGQCWPGSDSKCSLGDISPAALTSGSSSSSSSSSRYKTELCRSFTENGLCKYGGKCQFAHGMDELRDLSRHPKYKTEPCRTFHTIGFCPYGIRCHFVHNNEEERKHASAGAAPPPLAAARSGRPPLLRQSFSFAGFPSAPQRGLAAPPPATFSQATSGTSSPCADITDLLSKVFLEMDSAFEASPVHPYPPVTASDSPFLPSPDSGCSPRGPSPSRQSPGSGGGSIFPAALGARSLSTTSLSDQDHHDGSSSTGSLSGSESCSEGKRLAVFSQLSVPEDVGGVNL